MNLWKRFELLVETGPVFIGEVTAVHSTFGDQRCTVTVLPGSASMDVAGPGRSLEVGQRWIIRNGVIVEEAPAGPVLTVTI